ncbi:MAG: MoxR family ATPase [Xanthomonadales bacterium]|nr:MoxR family ATPase [Xanthomonadales bacterium]
MDNVSQAAALSSSVEDALHRALDQINRIVVGKESTIRLAMTCLIAEGHLLLEDVPGVGKTTLAHTLAVTTGLEFQRVQFTSDMLPADILGITIYSRERETFDFHPGPIFSQVMLADEVNRATPKTQSALLEAMAERQVTIEGQTRPLPETFFVIATQNPVDLAGTFPLPDSQMDRFLMRLHMGYPDAEAERRLLEEPDRQSLLADAVPCMSDAQLRLLQQRASEVHASPALLDYLQALIQASRDYSGIDTGLSPRGGLAILRCARAWALLDDRDHLIPEDLQAVFVAVAAHRLRPSSGNESRPEEVAAELLAQVPIQ